MMKDIEKYVFATNDDMNDGCGVLVGDLFVTAGHVVDEHPFRATIDGKEYVFDKKDALLYQWNEDEARSADSIDVAVFKVEGVHSPLTFASEFPNVGETLRSISYECKAFELESTTDFPLSLPRGTELYYDLNDCNAEVTDIIGNYIACKTGIILKPGSSGSPLLCGNKVVGILHSGNEGTNECAFLASKVIIDELNNK